MKKIFNRGVIAVIVFAFLGVSTLVAQEWTKEQKEIWEVVETGWAKWQEGDFDASIASIHEKYLGWNNKDPLPTSKEKWVKSNEAIKDYVKVEYYDLQPARILVYGNVAVVHYYFENYITYTKEDQKKEYNYKGKNAEFYIKEDGKWFLIGDMSIWNEKN